MATQILKRVRKYMAFPAVMPVRQPCGLTEPVAAITTIRLPVPPGPAADRLPVASTATTAAPGAAVLPIPEVLAAAEAAVVAAAEVHR